MINLLRVVSAGVNAFCAHTDHRCIQEMLRLTALLLPINDKEVDLRWVGHGAVSIRGDLNKKHVLDEQSKGKKNKKTSHIS